MQAVFAYICQDSGFANKICKRENAKGMNFFPDAC